MVNGKLKYIGEKKKGENNLIQIIQTKFSNKSVVKRKKMRL